MSSSNCCFLICIQISQKADQVIWYSHLLKNFPVCCDPNKGNAKECSNYCTIALISHTSKVMLKILQARLQQYMNHELQMFKLVLEKAEEPEIKLPTSPGSSKKQGSSSKKTSISDLLTVPKHFHCVDHNKLWKILKEMGIPDDLTCLLRNLYVGQEATVRTGHGTMNWFQIGKGVC